MMAMEQSEGRANVYLFSGAEEWLKREALDKLRTKWLVPGLEALNETVLEGATAQQIIDAAETVPVMAERRLVVVRDWAPLMPGTSRNEDAEVKRMLAWLDSPPETAVTVFYCRGALELLKQIADKRRKSRGGAVKLTAREQLTEKMQSVVFSPLEGKALASWIAKRLKPSGKSLAPDARELLAFLTGNDLTRMDGELAKLTAYVGDRTEITEADVREIVPPSLEYSIFQLLDKLLDKDLRGAEEMRATLFLSGMNATRMLGTLTSLLRQLAHMRRGLDAGQNAAALQRTLGMRSIYQAQQTAKQCRKRPADELQSFFAFSVEVEFAVKSGRLRDSAALDALFLRIAAPKLALECNQCYNNFV